MRFLALLAVVALAAPAAADEPRARCAACSFIPPGAIGTGDLVIADEICTSRDNGVTRYACMSAAIDANWAYLTNMGWRITGSTSGTALYLDSGNIIFGASALGIRSTSQNARVTFTASDGIDFATTNGSVQWSINPTTGNLDGTLQSRSVLAQGFQLFRAQGTAGSGTGYTTNETAQVVHQVHKITVARTALTAAATTEDETIWTVPAKTRVMRVIVDVTAAFDDAAGPITAVTIQCGPSAGSATYVPATSVFTVNTIGDVAAEIGTALTSATIADIPSFSATTAISCRFTSTGGNLSTLTTGSATFYIEHMVYP